MSTLPSWRRTPTHAEILAHFNEVTGGCRAIDYEELVHQDLLARRHFTAQHVPREVLEERNRQARIRLAKKRGIRRCRRCSVKLGSRGQKWCRACSWIVKAEGKAAQHRAENPTPSCLDCGTPVTRTNAKRCPAHIKAHRVLQVRARAKAWKQARRAQARAAA